MLGEVGTVGTYTHIGMAGENACEAPVCGTHSVPPLLFLSYITRQPSLVTSSSWLPSKESFALGPLRWQCQVGTGGNLSKVIKGCRDVELWPMSRHPKRKHSPIHLSSQTPFHLSRGHVPCLCQRMDILAPNTVDSEGKLVRFLKRNRFTHFYHGLGNSQWIGQLPMDWATPNGLGNSQWIFNKSILWMILSDHPRDWGPMALSQEFLLVGQCCFTLAYIQPH